MTTKPESQKILKRILYAGRGKQERKEEEEHEEEYSCFHEHMKKCFMKGTEKQRRTGKNQPCSTQQTN